MPYPGHGSGPGLYISLSPTLESKELPPESNQFLISQVREEMRMTVEKDKRNGTLQPVLTVPETAPRGRNLRPKDLRKLY